MNDKYLIKFLYCGRYRPNIYKILTNEINKFKKENPNKAKEIDMCKGNFIRCNTLKEIMFVCNNELS